MDTAIKARWVGALRSGEYEQTDGSLMREAPSGKMEYCCLGVLCDLAVKDGVIEPAIRYEDTEHFTDEERSEREERGEGPSGEYVFKNGTLFVDGGPVSYQGEVLPKAVMEWAGLTEQNPVITDVLGVVSTGDEDEDGELIPYVTEAASYNDDLNATFEQIATLIEEDTSL